MDLDQASRIKRCNVPARLHPFSRQVLNLYFDGLMPTSEFRRWFHMPNSDYLPISDCIAQVMDPNYIPERQLPASVTLKPPKSI